MLNVLVVDDTKAVHAYLRSILRQFSEVSLTSVYNGAEGLDALTGTTSFDLVLLDWEMPILNGPQTLEEIKKLSIATPVVMMTTKNSPDDIAAMLQLGAADYLMKPFTIDILIGKMEMVCVRTIAHVA